MRTDFKEERKWKVAMAYTISRAVMDWHWAEDKSTVCVKTRPPPPPLQHDQQEDAMALFDRAPSPDMNDLADTNVSKMNVEPSQPTLPTPPQQQSTTSENEPMAVEPSSLPQPIIQAYRTAIRDLDPNIPVYTLPIEDLGCFDIHTLFPDLLAYEPPNVSCDDPYFNELEYGRITGISQLSTRRIVIKKPTPQLSRKRNIDGEQITMPEDKVEPASILPRHERYDQSPLVSGMCVFQLYKLYLVAHASYTTLELFAPRKIRDTPAVQPRAPPQPGSPRQSSGWTEEDDLCLINQIMQFGFNWELITDTFNAARHPFTGVTRASWECYERWKHNNLTTLSGRVSSAQLSKLKKDANRKSHRRFDNAKRRQRQYTVFEAIKQSQKKREEAQRSTSKCFISCNESL